MMPPGWSYFGIHSVIL